MRRKENTTGKIIDIHSPAPTASSVGPCPTAIQVIAIQYHHWPHQLSSTITDPTSNCFGLCEAVLSNPMRKWALLTMKTVRINEPTRLRSWINILFPLCNYKIWKICVTISSDWSGEHNDLSLHCMIWTCNKIFLSFMETRHPEGGRGGGGAWFTS